MAVLEPQEALPGAASDNAPTYAEPEPAAQSRHGATLPGFDRVVNELRSRQSLPMAALGGLLAAVISAMIWAAITVMTRFQIGWMAVGVGVFVGGAVRTLGHGLDKPYGYLGAALSLFGCLLGNFLSACTIIARLEGLSPGVVLTQIDPAAIPALMIATSQPIDTLFYVIAVVMGYHFSFRRITQTHVSRVLQASER